MKGLLGMSWLNLGEVFSIWFHPKVPILKEVKFGKMQLCLKKFLEPAMFCHLAVLI